MALSTAGAQGARKLVLWYGGWSVMAFVAAGSGLLVTAPLLAFPGVVIAVTAALTASFFLSSDIRALARDVGPYGLATIHVWRIAAAVLFFWYGAQGLLPPVFVWLAGVGDMLAGSFAALVLWLPRTETRIRAFHLFGFADFVVAVGTGISLTVLAVPQMAAITGLPVALVPLIGVPLSGATHVAALHGLFSRPGRAVA